MAKLNLDLSDADINILFLLFDADHNESITYDEFLIAIRGVMNSRRAAVVSLAFDHIDRDGSGLVDIEELKDAFVSSQHPDVLSRERTAEAVRMEFLDTFDFGGKKPGKVSRDEFFDYYSNVSATIVKDESFESLIRSVWRSRGVPNAISRAR